MSPKSIARMPVRRMALTGALAALSLLGGVPAAGAQDALSVAQTTSPEGVVLGEDGDGATTQEQPATPQEDAPSVSADDAEEATPTEPTQASANGTPERESASRASSMPNTGGPAVPLSLAGAALLGAGLMLRRHTVRPARRSIW